MAADTDLVRLLIGDPDGTLLDDDQLALLIGSEISAYLAGAICADALAAKFSRSVTFSVEGLTIQNSLKADNYRKLADRLRSQAEDASGPNGETIGASVLGISKADMRSATQDTDRENSRFSVGMHDYPGTVLPSETDASDLTE
jgi:hypothetical protein